MPAKLDLLGKKFGRWTVISEDPNRDNWGNVFWNCICDCGLKGRVSSSSLNQKASQSCGCLHIDCVSTSRGSSKHLLYNRYKNMIDRCYNVNNPSYSDYGGRGIKIQEEWLQNPFSFYNYVESLEGYERIIEDEYEIDRIDNNLDYQLGNIRLATKSENCSNRRTNRTVIATSPTGEIYRFSNQKAFCKEHNLNTKTLSGWLNQGKRSREGWKVEYE